MYCKRSWAKKKKKEKEMQKFTVKTEDGVGQSEGVAADALVGHEVDSFKWSKAQLHRHLIKAGLVLLLAVFATYDRSHV